MLFVAFVSFCSRYVRSGANSGRAVRVGFSNRSKRRKPRFRWSFKWAIASAGYSCFPAFLIPFERRLVLESATGSTSTHDPKNVRITPAFHQPTQLHPTSRSFRGRPTTQTRRRKPSKPCRGRGSYRFFQAGRLCRSRASDILGFPQLLGGICRAYKMRESPLSLVGRPRPCMAATLSQVRA